MSKILVTAILLMFISIMAAGCADKTDMTDPKDVTASFMAAVESEDYEQAERFVLPSDRPEFRSDLEEGEVQDFLGSLPPFPTVPEWDISIDHNNASVGVSNWDIPGPMPLIRVDGKWYVSSQ